MGVGDFNLWRHQPHPPGYPLFIAFGWLGAHGFSLCVPDALALGSALGGGLCVACWFLLIARRFPMPVAWISAAALAGLLIMWMTSTKVLTDSAGAGFLALMLVVAGESRLPRASLVAAAAAGSVAVGIRPQNAGIVLLILCLATLARRGIRGRWIVSLGTFVAGCLLWLVPTFWLQAHTPEAGGDWRAYPRLLLAQWRWRLDQPKAFVGAGNFRTLLIYRLEHHPLGWLTRGFGLPLDSIWGWCAIGTLVLGWTFHAMSRGNRTPGNSAAGGSGFWREHLPWAAAYAGMIFCFLPGDQRYYLPIFPLLIVPSVAGWWSLPGRWRWLAMALPAITWTVTWPYAVENHREPAPPVRMIRWLQDRHPEGARANVWLILRDSRRHAEWYAPDFHIIRAEDAESSHWEPPLAATAVYTDDPALASVAAPQSGERWLLVRSFWRSPLIYRKHNQEDLYVREKVDR